MYWSAFYCQQTYASTQDDCGTKAHDAIAVKQGDAEQAMEAMSRLWSEETLGGKTRLKVDYPDQFYVSHPPFTELLRFN